jgi:ribose transport system substrate-binding protein
LQKIFRTAAVLSIALVGVLIALFQILKPDLSAEGKEKARLIGVSYMTMNNEFYRVMHGQISDRVEAEGDRIMLRNPALSAQRQIDEISQMLDAGIDALILTPVEAEGMTDILREAKKKGVIIVVVDTSVSDEELVDCTVMSDNYLAGELIGRYYLEKHDAADLVLIKHEAAASGRDRVQGFLDTVSSNPDIRVVTELDGEGQLEKVMPLMEDFLKTGTDFDSVFCLNDPSALGVIAALEASGSDPGKDIDVYGVDGAPEAKALIEEGRMEATVAQYPSKLGAEAADVLYRLLNGESTEKKILVPVELVTQENLDQYYTDRWL